MINPFVIGSVEEQAALQAYADRERWYIQCQSLASTLTVAQLRAYDADAQCYAATTLYDGHVVVAYVRRLAMEALKRGEAMPASAEAAVEAENMRALARWLR